MAEDEDAGTGGALIPSRTSFPAALNSGLAVPAIVADAGGRAGVRFLEFFTANIRNPNTRAAYAGASAAFLLWCEDRGRTLETIDPIAVAAYIERLQAARSKPTVKQHLAAIRMLFDWLVTGGVLPFNPAASVRGPKHVVKTGKTPVLTPEEARTLLDSIDVGRMSGLRDRALIGVMVYSFARVSAAVGMNVEDYYSQGKRWWLRLHEKGGKRHEVPAHHNTESYLDAYIEAAGIGGQKGRPLLGYGNDSFLPRARGKKGYAECRIIPSNRSALPSTWVDDPMTLGIIIGMRERPSARRLA